MPKNESFKHAPVAVSSEPTAKSTAVTAAVVPPVPRVKPHYVRIENRMRQVLRVSVINDAGLAEEIMIPALQCSHAVREDRLTDHTRNLVSANRARLV